MLLVRPERQVLLVRQERQGQQDRRVRQERQDRRVRQEQQARQELLVRQVRPVLWGSMLTRQQRSSANQQLAPTSLFRYPADIGSRWGNMSSSPPGATIKSQAAAPQLSIWITSATAATFLLAQLSQRPRCLLAA